MAEQPTENAQAVEPQSKPRPRLRRRLLGYAAVTLVGLVILGLVTDRWIMPAYTRHGSEFLLPQLVNKPLDEAKKIAAKSGFEIIVRDEQPSGEIPAGTILSQMPVPNTPVKKGRRVKVIVSSGVEMTEVPNLAGFSIRQAELRLPELGLKVGEYLWTESDTLPDGVISRTNPSAGSLVPHGADIDLYINRGYHSNEGYVPKLVGKSLADALTLLDSLGFPQPQIEYINDPRFLPRIITQQAPSPGTKVRIDSARVTLTVPVG